MRRATPRRLRSLPPIPPPFCDANHTAVIGLSPFCRLKITPRRATLRPWLTNSSACCATSLRPIAGATAIAPSVRASTTSASSRMASTCAGTAVKPATSKPKSTTDRITWGRAPSPVQAEQSSLRGPRHDRFRIEVRRARWAILHRTVRNRRDWAWPSTNAHGELFLRELVPRVGLRACCATSGRCRLTCCRAGRPLSRFAQWKEAQA